MGITYNIQHETLTEIADAIRDKNKSSSKILLESFANEITNIQTSPVLQDKTVTPTTSTQTIIADDGYDGLDTVTVNAMPTTPKARPSITVSSAGLITASSTQRAGYVTSGTTSSTKQLTVQAAQTITPRTSSQTAVASGVYTTGAVTVAAIPSNYEDVGTETSAYTTKLASLETAVTALETELAGKASGGSGGASIETCSLSTGPNHVTDPGYGDIACSIYENGQISTLIASNIPANTLISNNVIKNSLVVSRASSMTEVSDNLEPKNHELTNFASFYPYKITGDAFWSYVPCFAYNTKILLSDKTSKLIQDVTYQDDLLVWDFDNGCFTSAKPLWIKKAQTTNYYYLCKFANGAELKLIGSDGKCHRLLDIEKGSFESATECVGKQVMSNEGETVLVSCERVDEEIEFYNIITHTHINLFAEGMLTSCRLNNIYPIQNMKFIKDNRVKKLREDYPKIGSDMFRGLRIAKQPMSKEEIDTYVNRLYALMDWKPRYFVDDHTGSGKVVELSEAEYLAITGTPEIASCASKVYHNEITVDEIPEELRKEVQTVVNNKIARWGAYENQTISNSEIVNMVEEVL